MSGTVGCISEAVNTIEARPTRLHAHRLPLPSPNSSTRGLSCANALAAKSVEASMTQHAPRWPRRGDAGKSRASNAAQRAHPAEELPQRLQPVHPIGQTETCNRFTGAIGSPCIKSQKAKARGKGRTKQLRGRRFRR